MTEKLNEQTETLVEEVAEVQVAEDVEVETAVADGAMAVHMAEEYLAGEQ